ncbi:hypothetical protein [Chitinophaga nivalis]|uniref:Uncharacterized protein n=1 Tax=Chitinophaga nivalis TaxID=2991709 RepID=A0ABT3IM40_9BACT|nr:hypothetical protein [Chitinophaga nivalis]MCW3465264.1 hypothetical protein [Chitinophaga nivalis]MCW3485044.1 hypothetical protein [Chitinophaga nivalis]
MSDKMSLAGYDCNNQGNLNTTTEQLEYNMPFTEGQPIPTVPTYGMPVTVKAFFGMLNNFYRLLFNNPAADAIFQDIHYVEFSKASLFRVLSQEGCEYVRFNFVIPESTSQKLSLLAEGLDKNHDPIFYDQLLLKAQNNDMVPAKGDPKMEERGNGGETKEQMKDLFRALKIHNSPLADAPLPG